MASACKACNGMGWGHVGPDGFVDDGVPCSVCNADAKPKAAGSFAPKPSPTKTLMWVDSPGASSVDDPGQSPLEVGFTPAQVERQAALDREAERRERMR